ncbi:MAG: DUF1559 domain-containing protein [Planctomycetes bacterium]|nr:DUF1559 domain-containing protein [Planctomycetota bacterium]
MGRRAFSLIELLVVMGVIAILAGILLPLLANARELARKAKCSNNLRQLGTAMIQYVDHYGRGRFYSWPGTRSASFNGAQWIVSLYWGALIQDPEIFICPSTVDDHRSGAILGRKFTPLGPSDVSYAGRNGMIGVVTARMPTNTLMMSDDTNDPDNHDDGSYLLFFDAHVEWGEADVGAGTGGGGGGKGKGAGKGKKKGKWFPESVLQN